MPSAETMGNVYSRMDAGTVREAIHQVYGGLKRNKALPDNRGIPVAIVDGHESHARCRRHCSGCLERTMSFRTERPHSVLPPAGDAAAGDGRASGTPATAVAVGS